MPRNVLKYDHPVHGEIWVQHGSQAHQLFLEKKYGELERHLGFLFKKCYAN